MVPSIVISSSCGTLVPETIVKGILQEETLPTSTDLGNGFISYPWYINTKYYEADVTICTMREKNIGTAEFASSVNAVILCFDSESEQKLSPVEQWLVFTKEFEAEIKILVCERCRSENSAKGVSKLEAQRWCVENGFELVELNAEVTDVDSDVEDDFPESLGMSRIIQALHAHVWPNLKLKASHNPVLPPHFGLQDIVNGCMPEQIEEESGRRKSEESCAKIAMVKPMQVGDQLQRTASGPTSEVLPADHQSEPLKEHGHELLAQHSNIPREVGVVTPFEHSNSETSAASPANATASGDTTVPRDSRIDAMLEAIDSMPEDNFDQLFVHLSEMKTKASNLSPTHRKAYAEKMAIAFWNSIGGDPSEVNLSSDDEET